MGLPEGQLALLSAETATEDVRLIAEVGGVLYPGVEDGVARLSGWLPLFIVSNCQAGYIETLLDRSGLRTRFRDVECWGNTGLSKAANLARIVERNGLGAPVRVGDASGDQAAARECGIPFAHVDWGFGRCDDADYRFSSFEALTTWLITYGVSQ